MRRFESHEETPWLGGETLVHPSLSESPPPIAKRLITGGMLLLAGVGLSRLVEIGDMKRELGPQQDQIGDVETRAPSERRRIMQQRREEDRYTGHGTSDGVGALTILAAFGLGLVAGAVATLLTTPESGASVRRRMQRGMDTVKREFDETVGEAKQDWSAVSDEIVDSVKRTASRVKQAAEVTKEALATSDAPARRSS